MSDLQDLQAEYRQLVRRLQVLEHEYYVLGQPSVSDLEFDRLMTRLLAIEAAQPDWRLPDSPSYRVGSDLSAAFAEVRHTIPVLSLDKAYGTQEVADWAQRCAKDLRQPFSIVGEEKIDGLSIVLYYRQGLFDRAVTRGNGLVGNDVSQNAQTIRDIPLKLNRPVSGAFRGEIYLRKTDFKRLNDQQETAYANPRNLAGGSLRRAKSSEVANIPLRLFVYEGFYDHNPSDHWDLLSDLEQLGFVINRRLVKVTLPDQQDLLVDWVAQEAAQRLELDYEIDGLVFKIDQLAFREELGATDHHPRWAIAYKFESPQGLSRVIKIDTRVGRTGRITPVARIEPVEVGGAVIKNVTLHNQDYINALDLAVGDLVAVTRRGDVIPAIEEVVEKNTAGQALFRLPGQCPCCGSDLVRQGGHDFCRNFDCSDRARARLAFFVGRDQMNIDGIGPETIEVLWDQQLVRDIPDLYEFDPNKLADIPGFGPKKIAKLIAGLADSKTRPYSQVLVGLGIPELGPKVVSLLIESGFRSIDDLLAVVDGGNLERLQGIKGIGPQTIETLVQELSQDRLRDLINRLKAAGFSFAADPVPTDPTDRQYRPIFAGQVWCVTGSFDRFKPRDLAMDQVGRRGGQVVGNVTAKTTHLLVGDKPSGKLQKAQKLGIAIVTEAEFDRLLAESKV